MVEGTNYLATIIEEDDGFHVVDLDGNKGPVCKLCEENDKTIMLTKNAANRKYYSKAKARREIAEQGCVYLYFKEAKPAGSSVTRIPNDTIKISSVTRTPNAKLISYLPQDLQDEYNAIIARAIEAKNASKKKPMTEAEKLAARIAKMQAQYDAMVNDTVVEEN